MVQTSIVPEEVAQFGKLAEAGRHLLLGPEPVLEQRPEQFVGGRLLQFAEVAVLELAGQGREAVGIEAGVPPPSAGA